MTKQILYISYDGLTDPLGQSQVLPYLQGLSKQGYSFTILSFEKKNAYLLLKKQIEAICSGSNIMWVPLLFHSTPPLLSKWYDRWLMMKTAKKLHKENNFSMLHCRSYVSAEVGLFFQKKLGVPFLFDMRGFWADEKVDSRQWDLKKWWFRKIFNHYKKLEKQFVIQSKYIICLTNAGKKELFKLYEHELHNLSQSINQKCIVIPCCADLDLFDYNAINEEEKLKVKRQLSIKEKQTVISYSGSLGGWYMLDEMLDFFKTFKSEFTDAVFLCLTRDKHFVEKAIVEKKIDSNDIITLFAQKKELPLYLSLSFFSIFFIKPTYSKIASSPTKHAELMGLGIPVICNDIGDTGEIVITNKLGFLVKPGDKESYETAIKKMKDENFNKENIRNTGIAIFDVTKGVDLYAQVYQQIFDI